MSNCSKAFLERWHTCCWHTDEGSRGGQKSKRFALPLRAMCLLEDFFLTLMQVCQKRTNAVTVFFSIHSPSMSLLLVAMKICSVTPQWCYNFSLPFVATHQEILFQPQIKHLNLDHQHICMYCHTVFYKYTPNIVSVYLIHIHICIIPHKSNPHLL